MTKAAAIYKFWNSFGIKAYEENTVIDADEDGNPVEPSFPYITYQLVTDSFDREVAATASLWYRGESWTAINAKTEELALIIWPQLWNFQSSSISIILFYCYNPVRQILLLPISQVCPYHTAAPG